MAEVKAIGIDAGSTSFKIVGIDENNKIIFSIIEASEPLIEKQFERLSNTIKEQYDIDILKLPCVSTGYGSNILKQIDHTITEIKAHAMGIFEIFKKPGTLIDIGGQDSKVIAVGDKGKVLDFVMNDKCAAGTGRFIENTAWRLKIPIEQMAQMALKETQEVAISSTCAVFAESEVISNLARGVKLEKLIRGLHRSLVKRIVAMANIVGIREPLYLSGGVSKNLAIVKMMEEEVGLKPIVPENPQIVGALGAALEAAKC